MSGETGGAALQQSADLILASNRGPVTFRLGSNGNFNAERGIGSLAASLQAIVDQIPRRLAWLAAATGPDRVAVATGAAEAASRRLGYQVHFVPVDERTYSLYYEQVSNRMLWSANHALWDEFGIEMATGRELAAWTLGYDVVNRDFAERAAATACPDSCVLFQDYHLATAPAHLRLLRPDQPIAHFTHSSFCGPEHLRRLPEQIGRSYLQGMLGADLIGFHTAAWTRSFLDCCASYGLPTDYHAGRVKADRRWAWVRAYPMPVDAVRLRQMAQRDDVRSWAAHFMSASSRLLVRVDRVEPAKNILRGFDAFRLLLDRRKDLRNTRFVACLYGTRHTMPEYRKYMTLIHSRVAEIERRYPGSIELFVEDNQERALGALSCYDALLVNPLRDGMNLVAKEGALLNQRSGVLVLSSGAGAFDELGSAAVGIYHPTSIAETAAALERALSMPPAERAARARRLRSLAGRHSPVDWLDWQLRDLRAVRAGQIPADITTARRRHPQSVRSG